MKRLLCRCVPDGTATVRPTQAGPQLLDQSKLATLGDLRHPTVEPQSGTKTWWALVDSSGCPKLLQPCMPKYLWYPSGRGRATQTQVTPPSLLLTLTVTPSLHPSKQVLDRGLGRVLSILCQSSVPFLFAWSLGLLFPFHNNDNNNVNKTSVFLYGIRRPTDLLVASFWELLGNALALLAFTPLFRFLASALPYLLYPTPPRPLLSLPYPRTVDRRRPPTNPPTGRSRTRRSASSFVNTLTIRLTEDITSNSEETFPASWSTWELPLLHQSQASYALDPTVGLVWTSLDRTVTHWIHHIPPIVLEEGLIGYLLFLDSGISHYTTHTHTEPRLNPKVPIVDCDERSISLPLHSTDHK
ncbi:hypothetical protein QBC43DRAFT_350123 [Cladorrhinum sp. PSN259]|nr:hypothetical protein QBC43DRAFT_350123 [Cladorrhinum sp. PSN259]